MKYCEHCGQANNDSAVYCSRCGAPLPETGNRSRTSEAGESRPERRNTSRAGRPQNRSGRNRKTRSRRGGSIPALVAVLLAAVVIVISVLNSGAIPRREGADSTDGSDTASTGTGAGTEPSAAGTGNQWTILAYMCGNNLEYSADTADLNSSMGGLLAGMGSKNILEVKDAVIPDNVNYIMETGGTQNWNNNDIDASKLQRFEVRDHKLRSLTVDVSINAS